MELKVHQHSEHTDSCDQTKEHDSAEAEFSSETRQDLQLMSEGMGVDQLLSQRDEPETVSSGASEQGSVRLEPLTPSEVLEFEATEILHKGDDSSVNTSDTVSDQTDGSPGGSRAETAIDLADGKESS
ncbi:zinc finger protein 280D isoform X1 [Sigmodon hispidus]